MSLGDDFDFRRNLEYSSDQYNLVKQLQSKARKMAESYDNRIFHSEAITHVVHDTIPDIGYVYEDEYEAYQMKEMFCYIDDKSVCDAVYDSFYESKAKNKLQYVYNDIIDENVRARVRILTRQLWYSLVKL